MKGQVIAQEFKKMAWVSDTKGSEYACYLSQDRNIQKIDDLSEKEQQTCMNLNSVLGDCW